MRLDDLGGAETLSESQISLSKRATALEVALEGMEAKLSTGVEVGLGLYERLTGTLTNLCEMLGLERRERSVTSTASAGS